MTIYHNVCRNYGKAMPSRRATGTRRSPSNAGSGPGPTHKTPPASDWGAEDVTRKQYAGPR